MPEDDDKLSDEALFKAHVGPVRPIKSNPRIQPDRIKPKPFLRDKQNQPGFDPDDLIDIDPAGVSDTLFYAQNGLQTKTIKRLKQGRIPIDEDFDLHGLDQKKAEQALRDFLDHSIDHFHRCILIIHGKGLHGNERWPILKNLTQRILRSNPHVMAFCSAQARDGGLGATYVLLKRQNQSVNHQ